MLTVGDLTSISDVVLEGGTAHRSRRRQSWRRGFGSPDADSVVFAGVTFRENTAAFGRDVFVDVWGAATLNGCTVGSSPEEAPSIWAEPNTTVSVAELAATAVPWVIASNGDSRHRPDAGRRLQARLHLRQPADAGRRDHRRTARDSPDQPRHRHAGRHRACDLPCGGRHLVRLRVLHRAQRLRLRLLGRLLERFGRQRGDLHQRPPTSAPAYPATSPRS